MATIKIYCNPRQFKTNKETVNIQIRVIHNRTDAYIDTNLVALKKDFNTKKQLKDQAFLLAAEEICNRYRRLCLENKTAIKYMKDAADVAKFLLNPAKIEEDKRDIGLDFIQYAFYKIKQLQKDNKPGTARNYQTAINSLLSFIAEDSKTLKQELPVTYITADFLNRYLAFLRKQKSIRNKEYQEKAKSSKPYRYRVTEGEGRAVSLYLGIIRALHNSMKADFNDEDLGVINIPLSPFNKFKIPVSAVVRKRSVNTESVRKIIDLPYAEEPKNGNRNRQNLAKDCFILSFALIGMNSADLYNCPPIKKGIVNYNRQKTKDRRTDSAKISIKVQPEIEHLIKKYKDPDGKRAFIFYKLFRDKSYFNAAINKGLKHVEQAINKDLNQEQEPIIDLEYYAARHSWASIARNKCGIDKFTVHEALNHSDSGMKITDRYIDQDFSSINEANRKVLNYVYQIEEAKMVPLKAIAN